jgi:hypothetical protein
MGIFSIRVILLLRKFYNPFMFYFACVSGFLALNFFTYSAFIMWFLVTKQPTLLFWSDYWGRFFVYLSSVFAIQILLYKLVPKRPERFWGSVIVAALGIFLAVYNFIHPNYPYIDSLQIIHWQSPVWLGLGLAVMIVGIWLPTSFIFLLEFVKSEFRLVKSLYLGAGFLLAALGGALQDFGTTISSYTFINAVLIFGFILIFVGVILKDNQQTI